MSDINFSLKEHHCWFFAVIIHLHKTLLSSQLACLPFLILLCDVLLLSVFCIMDKSIMLTLSTTA